MKIKHWLGALGFIALLWINVLINTPVSPARCGWTHGTEQTAHAAAYWR